MFTYLIMDFYSTNDSCLEKQGTFYAEPHTHTPFCSVTVLSIHLALETTGDSRPHVLVPVQTHTLVPSGLF